MQHQGQRSGFLLHFLHYFLRIFIRLSTNTSCNQPWEISQTQNTSANAYPSQENSNGPNYGFQDNQLNGDDEVAWWQRKNVRITEVESGEEHKFGSTNLPASNDRPPQRSWVPPQPPPVVIPEAATAIRQPKKAAIQTEPMNDDQFLARSGDATATDELQRITKFSETGGSMEANAGGSEPLSTEIQREENGSYLET